MRRAETCVTLTALPKLLTVGDVGLPKWQVAVKKSGLPIATELQIAMLLCGEAFGISMCVIAGLRAPADESSCNENLCVAPPKRKAAG